MSALAVTTQALLGALAQRDPCGVVLSILHAAPPVEEAPDAP